MKRISAILAFAFASVLAAEATVHVDAPLDALGTWNQPNQLVDHPAFEASQVVSDMGRNVVVGGNTAGNPRDTLNTWFFSGGTESIGGQALSIEYTMRLPENSPVNFAGTQAQLFFNTTGANQVKRAIITPRRQGTFQFEVFGLDALSAETKVANFAVPGHTFPHDDYITFDIDRSAAGVWTVVESASGLNESQTETASMSLADLDKLEIRHMGVNAGLSSPRVYWAHLAIESVPEPATALLLLIGAGLLGMRRRK